MGKISLLATPSTNVKFMFFIKLQINSPSFYSGLMVVYLWSLPVFQSFREWFIYGRCRLSFRDLRR